MSSRTGPLPTKPELSVLMTVLNGERWIADQLDALAAQNSSIPWEVIVADNGCTDATMKIVETRAASFPVPLRSADARTRPGICHGRNVAAIAAQGRMFAFCDCDDMVGKGWVAAAVAALEHADIVGGICRELTEPFRTDSPVLVNGPFNASFGYSVPGGNFAIHRDIFFAIGGFDESMPPYGCDDVEFSIRANDFGARITNAPEMCIYFRPTVALRSNLRKLYRAGLAEMAVWHRHRGKYGAELGWPARKTEFAHLFVATFFALIGRHPIRPLPRRALSLFSHIQAEVGCAHSDIASLPVLIQSTVIDDS